MVVSHHYLIGMTVPVLSFLIVTCKLLDCVPAMGKSNERGVSGFLSELRPCRTTFSRQLYPSPLFARQFIAYPYILVFQSCRQVFGSFASKAAVRFNRLLFFEWSLVFFRSYNPLFFGNKNKFIWIISLNKVHYYFHKP